MKNVTLTYKREHIIYDISNCAFVEGDTIATENEHLRHQITDIAQEGNIDRVNRILSLAHAEIVEMLYPYTKDEVVEGVYNNDPESYKELKVVLSLPDGFSATSLNLLRKLIHEYLVCRILVDWFTIALTQGAELWTAKLAAIREQIKSTIANRRGALVRPLRPF